jgi:hypothetical protein
VPPGEPEPAEPGRLARTFDTLQLDHARFYRRGRALRFGGVLAGAAALANSSGDEEIQQWYGESVRSDSLDELSADVNFLGDGEKVAIPLALAGLAVGLAPREDANPAVRWLRRTSRGYILGTPALLYLQTFTGGDRPSEGGGSGWDPFEGQNGVSGHAFLGAVPFLTIARQTDRRWVQALALLGSTAAGWSQFNDDQHFFSQYALGWWLAWEATDAVAESDALALDAGGPAVAVLPLPAPDGAGVLVSLRF